MDECDRTMQKTVFLYIDCMYLGGAQRVMSNISDYLINNNYRVILINDIIPVRTNPEYAIDTRITRYYLDEGNNSTQRVYKNIYRIRRLRALIRKEKPDVIVSFLGPPNLRMLAATVFLHTKKIVSVRNDPYREYGSGIIRIVSRNAFRLADGCVFQTEEAATYFPKSVQEKSRIILNPVAEKFYNVKWTGERKEIAVVGRLQPQKNPLLVLEAFHRISQEYPDYKIVYYGDDELKEQILKKSIEYNMEHQVQIYGKTMNIEQKLASSTVFVLSSDFEGMPNALLEAMAVGVPVIATDCPCGGPRTAIENEMQGILVPCRDAELMGQALKTILSNKDLRDSMSKNEKKRAEEYRTAHVMQEWIDYLNY